LRLQFPLLRDLQAAATRDERTSHRLVITGDIIVTAVAARGLQFVIPHTEHESLIIPPAAVDRLGV